jgi:hypothetical protein
LFNEVLFPSNLLHFIALLFSEMMKMTRDDEYDDEDDDNGDDDNKRQR